MPKRLSAPVSVVAASMHETTPRSGLVQHQAPAFADRIYGITKAFPDDERFGLTSQMRRAAASISPRGKLRPKPVVALLALSSRGDDLRIRRAGDILPRAFCGSGGLECPGPDPGDDDIRPR